MTENWKWKGKLRQNQNFLLQLINLNVEGQDNILQSLNALKYINILRKKHMISFWSWFPTILYEKISVSSKLMLSKTCYAVIWDPVLWNCCYWVLSELLLMTHSHILHFNIYLMENIFFLKESKHLLFCVCFSFRRKPFTSEAKHLF